MTCGCIHVCDSPRSSRWTSCVLGTCRLHLIYILYVYTGSMRNSNRTNERGRPQRPLGAHPRRRRSTLLSIQEVSPQHYTRPESDSRSDVRCVDELEREEQQVNAWARPLAAHHSRRRIAMMGRLQRSVAPAAEPTSCTVPNGDVNRDSMEKLKPKQGRSQGLMSGQTCESLPPRRKKLAWTN
jgi:hypothetical protein